MFKKYYQLTKPGIIYGNSLSAAGGFLLASAIARQYDLWLFVVTMIGIGLVIGSACVFNNYIDRDIDSKMQRTKNRGLATGAVDTRKALAFGGILGVVGFWLLALNTNLLTVGVGVVGFVDYLIVYGLAKRKLVQGTIIGSIAGATPVLAGYTAVSNSLDAGAVLLFLILVFWQMPHFYAIAMFRSKDYAAARIPVLPLVRGTKSTKLSMIGYIVAFVLATVALTALGYTGYIFAIVMAAVGAIWLWRGLKGLRATTDEGWARRMFGFSLIVLLILSLMLAIGRILP